MLKNQSVLQVEIILSAVRENMIITILMEATIISLLVMRKKQHCVRMQNFIGMVEINKSH